MKDAKERTKKKVDLGRCGEVTLHLDEGHRRLLIEFAVDPDGFDKAGLNAVIDSLKKVREKMER